MTPEQVLEVMRDHTKVATSGSIRVCVCGQGFETALLHTVHVAEQIAAATEPQAPAPPPNGGVMQACELRDDHLWRPVTVPADLDALAEGQYAAEGLLVGAAPWSPEPLAEGGELGVLIELMAPGGAHVSGYLVDRHTLVEVHA